MITVNGHMTAKWSWKGNRFFLFSRFSCRFWHLASVLDYSKMAGRKEEILVHRHTTLKEVCLQINGTHNVWTTSMMQTPQLGSRWGGVSVPWDLYSLYWLYVWVWKYGNWSPYYCIYQREYDDKNIVKCKYKSIRIRYKHCLMRYDDKHKRDCVQNNTGIKSNIWSISSSSTLVKLVQLTVMAQLEF